MANPLVEFSIAARFAARALGKRLSGSNTPAPDTAAFESQMQAALVALPAGVVRDDTNQGVR